MSADEAIRMVFVKACMDFRSAKRDGRDDDADMFLQVTEALEAAYPEQVAYVNA